MKNENLTFSEVDFNNAKEAIETQRKIFKEDGMLNILASLDRDIFMRETGLSYIDDHIKYYLAYRDGEPVGITGLYYYNGFEDEMWLAWFGVLKEYRNHGIGTDILKWTITKVIDSGRSILRLYTDPNESPSAVELYKKMGFREMKYESEELSYDCHIFSKELQDKELLPWDDRNLCLAHQSELENVDEKKKDEILRLYETKYFKN